MPHQPADPAGGPDADRLDRLLAERGDHLLHAAIALTGAGQTPRISCKPRSSGWPGAQRSEHPVEPPNAAGGYFALPILYQDRLVGKLDATADRTAGVLRVDAVHRDVPFGKTMTAAVDGQIKDLARWLELDLVPSGRS